MARKLLFPFKLNMAATIVEYWGATKENLFFLHKTPPPYLTGGLEEHHHDLVLLRDGRGLHSCHLLQDTLLLPNTR